MEDLEVNELDRCHSNEELDGSCWGRQQIFWPVQGECTNKHGRFQ